MDTLTELLTAKIRQLETTLDLVGAYVFTKDKEGRYTYANKMVCNLFGKPLEQIVGATDDDFFDLSFSNELRINDRRILDQGERIETEEKNINKSGETRIYWTVKQPLLGSDGLIVGICGVSTDITERTRIEKAVHESEERYRIMFMDSPDAYLIIRDGVLVDCNRAGEFMLRGDRTQIIGKTPDSLSPEFQPDGQKSSSAAEKMIKDALTKGSNSFEWVHCRLDGTEFFVEVTIAPMLLEGKQCFFTSLRDITERKLTEKALEESKNALEALSITDGLTGLANRRRFDEMLELEFQRHVRTGAELSLILLDVDFFKSYNDHYGHLQGDECLRRIADTLGSSILRPSDLAARYGGEEFAVILPETGHSGSLQVAERIRTTIAELVVPHAWSTAAPYVTISLGAVTMHCIQGEQPEQLLEQADRLLYEAKRTGRNRVVSRKLPFSAKQKGMPLVQLVWSEALCSENRLIDSQHQELLKLANRFFEAIQSGRPEAEIRTVVARLLDELQQHFNDEEQNLRKAGYPGLEQHAREHARLLAHRQTLADACTCNRFSPQGTCSFLIENLVIQHFLNEDRQFFEFLKTIPADPSITELSE